MKYPTLKAWYHHVNNLKTADEINESVKEFRRGQFRDVGIHPFRNQEDVGRALKALVNHAEKILNLRMHPGTGMWLTPIHAANRQPIR